MNQLDEKQIELLNLRWTNTFRVYSQNPSSKLYNLMENRKQLTKITYLKMDYKNHLHLGNCLLATKWLGP